MSPRTRSMTLVDCRIRAGHARSFITAAELVCDLGEDAGIDATGNTIASLAVLAGIAASDAIAGMTTGERSASESHQEATRLLQSSATGRSVAAPFKRLIDAKSEAAYSPRLFTRARADELLIAATHRRRHGGPVSRRRVIRRHTAAAA